MPILRGVENLEGRTAEPDLEAKREVDREAEPFTHPLPPVSGEASSSYQQARSEGLKDFLAIGEKGSSALFQEKPPAAPEVPHLAEVTLEPGLLRSMAQYIQEKLPDFFDGIPIGPVGPMMIFSSLFKDGLKAPDAESFFARLHQYNDELSGYDAAQAARVVHDVTLVPELEKILRDPRLNQLAEERLKFLEENREYYRFLNDRPEMGPANSVYWKLREHAARELGSQFYFGEGQIFENEIDLIQFSESLVSMVQRGEWPPYGEINVPRMFPNGRMVGLEVQFKKSGEIVEKGAEVLQVEFSKPIGREGYALLRSGEETVPPTDSPGRVLEGERPETRTLVIVAKQRENYPGHYRLDDIVAGTFGWRRHDAGFWEEHAYLSGKSGVRRGFYNNWVQRRPGFEILKGNDGLAYSIQPWEEGKKAKSAVNGKRVRVEPGAGGLFGYNLPGDRQSQIIFKVVGGKEKITLTMARNQTGYFLGSPEQVFLLSPYQEGGKHQGFVFEEEIPFLWEPGRVYQPGLLSRLIGWFFEEGGKSEEIPEPKPNPGFGLYRIPTRSDDGFYVRAEDGRRLAMRIYPAGEEPGYSPAGNSESGKYYQLLRVDLLSHSLNGEQRVRLQLRRTDSDKKTHDQVLTLSAEEARNLGAIGPGPEGRIFAHPKNFWLMEDPEGQGE